MIAASKPPFATKEPDRYQAVRTITSSEGGVTKTGITKTFIARDGNMRREDYETTTGERIVYLEIPAGNFLLLPAAKLLADLNGDSPTTAVDSQQQALNADLSTERLLNQTIVETQYESLGPEIVNGRAATKYRVLTGERGKSAAGNSETLLWIDDILRMPVRWETTLTAGEKQTKTTMELSDISLDVDRRTFELPQDYRTADIREMRALIRGDVPPQKPKGARN